MIKVGLFANVLAGASLLVGMAQTPPPAKDIKPSWLTPEQAAKVVVKSFASLKDSTDPPKLIELDVPEVREKMRGQVFRDTRKGPSGDVSFLIIDQKSYQLGFAMGGYGLTSLCITDLDQNGEPELIYTYSWGSGHHRSLLGILSKTWKYRPVEFAGEFSNADWVVRDAKDGSIELLQGHPKAWDPSHTSKTLDIVCRAKIGTIVLRTVKGKPDLQVDYVPNLPEYIKRSIRFWKGN